MGFVNAHGAHFPSSWNYGSSATALGNLCHPVSRGLNNDNDFSEVCSLKVQDVKSLGFIPKHENKKHQWYKSPKKLVSGPFFGRSFSNGNRGLGGGQLLRAASRIFHFVWQHGVLSL